MEPTKPKVHWSPSVQNSIVEFSAQTSCTYLELLVYPRSSSVVMLEGTLDDASLLAWFQRDYTGCTLATDEQPSKSPSGLRLLIGTCDVDATRKVPEVSFTKEAFATIQDRLGLPEQYLSDIPKDHLTRTKAFSCNDSSKSIQGLIFKIAFYRRAFHQLSISHDRKTGITYGIILLRDAPYVLPPLLARLTSYQADLYTIFHPLLLPVLAIEREIERTSRRLHGSDSGINELEELMGQHEYANRPRGNPLELDFTAATRKLNYIGKTTAVDALNLGCLIFAFETIESWNTAKERERKEDSKGFDIATSRKVEDEITRLKDSCRSLLLLAEYEDKRIKILIQVVYQFMAQKDVKVNIELASSSANIARASKVDSAVMRQIAIEAKRDSSAMKTIAVLGMLFLPGTFVAAIFAMPVFDWDGGQLPAVKTGFGYYWAVVIPLTVVVMVSWAVTMFLPWKKWLSRFGWSYRAEVHATELAEIDDS